MKKALFVSVLVSVAGLGFAKAEDKVTADPSENQSLEHNVEGRPGGGGGGGFHGGGGGGGHVAPAHAAPAFHPAAPPHPAAPFHPAAPVGHPGVAHPVAPAGHPGVVHSGPVGHPGGHPGVGHPGPAGNGWHPGAHSTVGWHAGVGHWHEVGWWHGAGVWHGGWRVNGELVGWQMRRAFAGAWIGGVWFAGGNWGWPYPYYTFATFNYAPFFMYPYIVQTWPVTCAAEDASGNISEGSELNTFNAQLDAFNACGGAANGCKIISCQ